MIFGMTDASKVEVLGQPVDKVRLCCELAEVSSRLTLVTRTLVDGLMPPTGGLALTDRQLFQAWVDQGAKDN